MSADRSGNRSIRSKCFQQAQLIICNRKEIVEREFVVIRKWPDRARWNCVMGNGLKIRELEHIEKLLSLQGRYAASRCTSLPRSPRDHAAKMGKMFAPVQPFLIFHSSWMRGRIPILERGPTKDDSMTFLSFSLFLRGSWLIPHLSERKKSTKDR